MLRRVNLGAWGIVLGVGALSKSAAAESNTRFHIGLESSIYNSTSIEGTTSTASNSTSSAEDTKYVSKTSGFGLPGDPSLPFGVLLGDHWDLGARFGYTTASYKVGNDSTAANVESSAFVFSPYLAYLAGSRDSNVRFTVGATAGLGSTSSTATWPSTSGSSAPPPTETTTSLTQFGAFLGIRAFVNEMGSLDPMLMLLRSSATYKAGSTSVDMTGTTIQLGVGFSFWSRGGETTDAPTSPAPHPAAPASASPSAAQPPGDAAPAAEPVERSDRITLSMGDSHAVTFILGPANEAPQVTVILRDDAFAANSSCKSVTFHAFRQEETAIDVSAAMASTNTRRFPILKGSIALDRLRLLTMAPLASNASAPDHWIDVCEQRWLLYEEDRGRLKRFFDALPPPSPALPPDDAPSQPPAPQ
ncbi:MAG TPA: hypothetical protein VIV60_09150 [Polyangiaceae bacterium]